MKAELEGLEAECERLEHGIQSAPNPKPLLHTNLAELYRKNVAEQETIVLGDNVDPDLMVWMAPLNVIGRHSVAVLKTTERGNHP